METIVKMKFGSHLYGTDTPDSDTDYKGIYLPSKEDCYLNNIVKTINKTTGDSDSKNTKDDIDEEYYSLQYFLKLAEKGEMIIIDMLHAPDNMILESSKTWEELRANRSKFYTKNLSGYLGYIRKQASKYGVKGSRLAAMKEVITYFKENAAGEDKLENWWDNLPINEYAKIVKAPQESRWGFYEVCGKKFGATVRVHNFLASIEKMYDSYGARAKLAERNEGIDWKAISHALRASYQLIEIYETGDLKYPLTQADYLRDVKLGKYHYVNDGIGDILESNLTRVEALSAASKLPDTFNKEWAELFIINRY